MSLMRKLAGLVGKRGISSSVSESPARGLLGMWRLLHEPATLWWALSTFKIPLALALFGVSVAERENGKVKVAS